MSTFLQRIFNDDAFNAKYKVPRSYIDRVDGSIFFRALNKSGEEWIVSGESIVISTPKKKEQFFISQISKVNLKMDRYFGTLEISGKIPKSWFRGAQFNLADMLIAHAVAVHIVESRQGNVSYKIDPALTEMRRLLDAGELEEQQFNMLKEKGVLDALGFTVSEPDATIVGAPLEISVPQPQASPSVADELLKLKNLVDMGVLTQEEFDRKKSKLLGE